MNKEHFLIELKIYLKPLSTQQQLFILNKYETIFNERLQAGETEEEIAKSLGKPRTIAEEILQEFDITVPEKKINRDGWEEIDPPLREEPFYDEAYEHPYDEAYHSYDTPTHTGFGQLCRVIGILGFNFLFMIWVIFTYICLLFSGWLVAITFLISPVLVGVSALFWFNEAVIFQLFFSIFLAGAGMIGFLILRPLTSVSIRALKRYFRWNVRVLRGEQ